MDADGNNSEELAAFRFGVAIATQWYSQARWYFGAVDRWGVNYIFRRPRIPPTLAGMEFPPLPCALNIWRFLSLLVGSYYLFFSVYGIRIRLSDLRLLLWNGRVRIGRIYGGFISRPTHQCYSIKPTKYRRTIFLHP